MSVPLCCTRDLSQIFSAPFICFYFPIKRWNKITLIANIWTSRFLCIHLACLDLQHHQKSHHNLKVFWKPTYIILHSSPRKHKRRKKKYIKEIEYWNILVSIYLFTYWNKIWGCPGFKVKANICWIRYEWLEAKENDWNGNEYTK